jgi:hypothetical protein
LDSTDGHIQTAFLPLYSSDLNPVEYLWAWLKRHALANFCPDNFAELQTTARNELKSAQHHPNIIAAWIPDAKSGILQFRRCTSNLNPPVMKYVMLNNYDFPALFRPAKAVDGE